MINQHHSSNSFHNHENNMYIGNNAQTTSTYGTSIGYNAQVNAMQ
jgi:hypothetical protein